MDSKPDVMDITDQMFSGRSCSADIQQGIFRMYSDYRLDAKRKLAWYIEMYMSTMSQQESNRTIDRSLRQQQSEAVENTPTLQETEYQLSILLIEMINIVIYEMKDEHGDPLWNWDQLKRKIRISNNKVLLEAIQAQENLYRSKRLLHQIKVSEEFRRECWQSFQQMEREMLGEQHRLYLVKAWLDFIEQQPELIEECMQLSDRTHILLQ